MNLMNIIIMVIFVVFILNITKEKDVPVIKMNNDTGSAARSARSAARSAKIQQTIPEDIMINNRGKNPLNDTIGEFPIPQTTTTSKNLSPNVPEDLSIIANGSNDWNKDLMNVYKEMKPKDNDTIADSRFPKYFRKDNMSGSTIGTTEYTFAEVDNNIPAYAWQDKNVSQYPNYYTSDFKGGLTNSGSFFDQNNRYVDLTGPRSEANVGDVCYTSKNGEKVCLENDRLQNVPPSLISDKYNCNFLNSIGLLEFSNTINESSEKVMNGGKLYDQVQGSMKYNERFSKPIQQQVLTCEL